MPAAVDDYAMNKAFVREPDAVEDSCPRCGSAGLRVTEETLKAFLSPDQLRHIAPASSFCPLASCEVAYFDGFERMILARDLGRTFYPKDPTAPLCPCFGLTCEDIEQDVRDGVVTRTRAAVQRAKTDEAMCTIKSPSGRSCVADVQKYYMKCRIAAEQTGS
jgi:hypothetical protein